MLKIIASLSFIFIILMISEYLWRKKILRYERARKFVHILVGLYISSWPWFMSWRQIQLFSVALLIVVIISRRYKIFRGIMDVKRRTYGEETYAIAVGAAALMTTSKAIFAIAILHMALADAIAALAGKQFGYRWSYKLLGQYKTIIGSMVFWLVSVLILGIGLLVGDANLDYSSYVAAIIVIPPIVTIVENLAIWGLDNLAIPIVVISLLQSLQ